MGASGGMGRPRGGTVDRGAADTMPGVVRRRARMAISGVPADPEEETAVITVVGEALVDLVRRPGGEVVAHPGGSPANVAVGLARLGASVALVTSYGKDEYGDLLAEHLTGNGVTVLGEVGSPQPTSVAEATLDAAGVATYDFRIHWELSEDPRPADGSVCVHTGSIAATLEPGASAVARMLDRARGEATLSYDPNCRPTLMGTPEQARERIEGLVAGCDVVKVSDEDLRWLYPGEAYDDAGRRWLASGPALVVVTRGGEGSWGVTAAGAVLRPPLRVDIADTVGAGDAFMAGLIDGLRRRELLGAAAAARLRAVDEAVLDELLAEADLVAAITCSRPGADPPTAAEVAARR